MDAPLCAVRSRVKNWSRSAPTPGLMEALFYRMGPPASLPPCNAVKSKSGESCLGVSVAHEDQF